MSSPVLEMNGWQRCRETRRERRVGREEEEEKDGKKKERRKGEDEGVASWMRSGPLQLLMSSPFLRVKLGTLLSLGLFALLK